MNLMCTIAKERLQRDYWEQQARESVGQPEAKDESDDKKTPTA
ncbi:MULTISPECIES: small protein SR7P [unclassified Bacillus (in: firmicutes)]